MNILIIDDDLSFIDRIKRGFFEYFSNQFGNINFEIKNSNFFSIDFGHTDIAFIDIDLKTCSGINYAKFLKATYPQVIIVFVSSREELSFKTFTTGVFQFIRKAKYENDKIIIFDQLNDYCKERFNKIVSLIKGKRKILNTDNIIYVLSFGHVVTIETNDENDNYELNMSLPKVIKLLNLPFLIQRNLFINLNLVDNIEHKNIILFNGKKYPICRKYQQNVINKYEEFLLK